jgi:peptidoglycan/LPS O-acetylase OafA/YrhL
VVHKVLQENPFSTLESCLSQGKIPALDGVRAIAISLVVVVHLHIIANRKLEESLGRTGVTLFFVLSGFLITWLLLKEDRRTGTVSLSNFYMRRFLRIFPGFYCFWIVYVSLALLAHRHVSWGNCGAAEKAACCSPGRSEWKSSSISFGHPSSSAFEEICTA